MDVSAPSTSHDTDKSGDPFDLLTFSLYPGLIVAWGF